MRCSGVSPALKREIRAFAFLYVDAYPDCFIPTGADPTFELQLDTIRALSDADAALRARPPALLLLGGGGRRP